MIIDNEVLAVQAYKAFSPEKRTNNHTVQVNIDATTTAITVSLAQSLDGVEYKTIDTHVFDAGELVADSAIFTVQNIPARYLRLSVDSFTGDGNISAYYEGS